MNLEGTRLDKYELRAEIGRGAMGVVYRGYDPDLGRSVAVKILAPHRVWEKQFVERFLREARAAAQLDHPNIVTVYDVGEESGWYYFVMKYLEGGSLSQILNQQGRLSPDGAIAVLRQLAAALDYAHAKGVVHRDVKPANVMVDGQGRVTLTDFGLVKAAQESGLTATGTVLGTPHYMSPEQVSGKGDVGPASDLYSLAVIAYEMLSGGVPFDAESTPAILYAHVYEPLPPISQKSPDVPPNVDPVLGKALAKEPGKRYRTCADFAAALSQALGANAESTVVPVLSRVSTAAQEQTALPSPQPVKQEPEAGAVSERNRIITLGATVIVLLAVMVACGVILLGGGGSARPTATAAVALEETDTVPAVESTEPVVPTFTAPIPTEPSEPTVVSPTEPPDLTSTPLAPLEAGLTTETPTQEPTIQSPAPVLGDIRVRAADGMQVVYLPPGKFQMGSTDGDDEQPVHTVSLDGLWMDRTEVTAAQFSAFLNSEGNQMEGGVNWLNIEGAAKREVGSLIEVVDGRFQPLSGYEDHPAIHVSWYGARNYCEWVGSRLPTEAEWEYAARGPEGNVYPWGDSPPTCDLAQFEDCEGQVIPVDSLPAGASWAGVLGMAGNVWEWTADWYGEYPSAPQVNPTGPATGEFRVLRGAAWSNRPIRLVSSNRTRVDPYNSSDSRGFRCVESGTSSP